MNDTAGSRDTAGNRIRERRKDLGMTQDELAKALGYGRTWLVNIETDKRPLPGTDTLLRLCEILKTTPTYILTGYEENDITLGQELGLSGNVMQSLKQWKESCDADIAEHGDNAFPISSQIDFIVSVLVRSPLTVMMLHEYLNCKYDRVIVLKTETESFNLPAMSIFAENGFFSTHGDSIEPWARFALMDQIQKLRDSLINRKDDPKDGKS